MNTLISAVHKTEIRFRQYVAIAVGGGSMGMGISLILLPHTLEDVLAFHVTVEWAAPAMWGVSAFFMGAVLIAAAFISIRIMVWPAAALAFWYAGVVTSLLIGVGTRLPMPATIWMYLTMGVISGLLALSSASPLLRK